MVFVCSTGHTGTFGHEFMEFTLEGLTGEVRYANVSRYKSARPIRKRFFVAPAVVDGLRAMIEEAGADNFSDETWPQPDKVGKQELEIVIGRSHLCLATTVFPSALAIKDAGNPVGLEKFHFFTQDLTAFFLSLLALHFKIDPLAGNK